MPPFNPQNRRSQFARASRFAIPNRPSVVRSAGTPFGTVNTGTQFRIRKGGKPTLTGAIFGVLIGIILVLASPYVLWKAESQHKAKDFQAAQQVDVSQVVNGYVSFQGTPTVDEPLTCLGENNCLYTKLSNQKLTTVQEEQCGTVSDDATVLYETVVECDEDGTNCGQCYMVERDVWEDVKVTTDFTSAKVGEYTVQFNATALMLGLEENTNYLSDTERDVLEYFPIPTELLVAGDSSNGVIDGAETTYVLSPYGYDQTLQSLEASDAANKWIFRVIAFIMMFVGFGMIFGPISYFAHLMRNIPLVGKLIKEGTGLIVGLVSFLLAVAYFVVAWFLIAVIKNIIVIVGLLVVILVVIVVMTKRNQSKDPQKEVKSETPQEPTGGPVA